MPLIDGVRQGILAHSLPEKTTPVDADEFPMTDSAAGWAAKRFTWANLKAAAAGAAKVAVPSSKTAPGKPGQWSSDASFVYFYTGNGTAHSWGRVAFDLWVSDPVADEPVAEPVADPKPATTTKTAKK